MTGFAPTVTTVGAKRFFAAFDIVDELTREHELVASQAVPGMRRNCVHAV